jgi:prolyl 4-hydroxylase
MKLLDERIARLTHIPTEHQEHAQVLRYKQSGKYDAHHDFFDYRLYTKDPSTLRILLNGARNRMLTVLWYLNDVSSGGETVFPRAGAQPSPSDMTDCTKVCCYLVKDLYP